MRVCYYESIDMVELWEDKKGERKVYIYQGWKEHTYVHKDGKIFSDFNDKESFNEIEKQIKAEIDKLVKKGKEKNEAEKEVAKMKDWGAEIKVDRYEYKVVVGDNSLSEIIEKLLEWTE